MTVQTVPEEMGALHPSSVYTVTPGVALAAARYVRSRLDRVGAGEVLQALGLIPYRAVEPSEGEGAE